MILLFDNSVNTLSLSMDQMDFFKLNYFSKKSNKKSFVLYNSSKHQKLIFENLFAVQFSIRIGSKIQIGVNQVLPTTIATNMFLMTDSLVTIFDTSRC